MKYIKTIIKVPLAGLTALAILCALMFGYNYIPLREKNPNKNTDYVWQANTPWVRATEGVSVGLIDSQGFNNKVVIDNPDVLVVGSSHAEAQNVMQDENFCSLLNDKFDGEYEAYNMSISGHNFYKATQYLPATLQVYSKVPKYIIIETDNTALSEQDVSKAINGEVEITPVNDTGVVAELQKLPYLRAMYHQLTGGMLNMLLPEQNKKSTNIINTDNVTNVKVIIDEAPYEQMFNYLQKLEQDFDTNIIIMYHPFEKLNDDGSISFGKEDYTSVFAQYAEKHDITFVNMTDDFREMYESEHHVPHGFVTGKIGSGHLNKYGHAAIADRLYQTINEMEGK